MEKFFDESGVLKQDEIDTLHRDIAHLIIPSSQRAIILNKAYKVIVEEQSYIYGRDAHVRPAANIHDEVEIDQSTGVSATRMKHYPLQ